MDVSWTVVAAIIAGCAGVLGALITGFFVSGKVSQQIKQNSEDTKTNKEDIKRIEATLQPINTLFMVAKIAELPERLSDFKNKLEQSVAGVTSMSARMDRMVTREEFNARFNALSREQRACRRRMSLMSSDVQLLLVKAGYADRAQKRERELAMQDADDDKDDSEEQQRSRSSEDGKNWANDTLPPGG